MRFRVSIGSASGRLGSKPVRNSELGPRFVVGENRAAAMQERLSTSGKRLRGQDVVAGII